MGRKLIYFSLLIGAILFCPWPITLAIIIIVSVILGSLTTAFVAALSFDWLYGTTGHLTLGLIIVAVIFLFARLGRQFVRWHF